MLPVPTPDTTPAARTHSCGAITGPKNRIPQHQLTMMGAGAYGLNEKGHGRVGAFPTLMSDDMYVDTRFDMDEKAVVATDGHRQDANRRQEPTGHPASRIPRCRRAVQRLLARRPRAQHGTRDGSLGVVGTIRGPVSAVDAVVYLAMALAGRWRRRRSQSWERDESSRLGA